jgi:hypothetical protein
MNSEDNKELESKYLELLKQLDPHPNQIASEESHIAADDILCELLFNLGFDKIVDAYNKIPKWYA